MATNWGKITNFFRQHPVQILLCFVIALVITFYVVMITGCLFGSASIKELYWASIKGAGGAHNEIRIGYFGLCVREPTGFVCFRYTQIPIEPAYLATSPILQAALFARQKVDYLTPVIPLSLLVIGIVLRFFVSRRKGRAKSKSNPDELAKIPLLGSAFFALASALACLGLAQTLEGSTRIVTGGVQGPIVIKAGWPLLILGMVTAALHILLVLFLLWKSRIGKREQGDIPIHFEENYTPTA